MAFVTPVMEHWLEREIAQWVDPMTHCTMGERSYHRATSRSRVWEGVKWVSEQSMHTGKATGGDG